MIKAVRAIIIHKDNILLMEREKFGKLYYTLIGGHVELGEGLEKALLREVHEETMVRISNPRLVYIQKTSPPYGTQYIYECTYISGVPMLHPDADERQINKGGQNIYTPMWVPIKSLAALPFLPEELKHKVLEGYESGYPQQPQEFSVQ